MGSTVSLVLLSGCPSNCIVAGTIVEEAPNTGSYSWTPDCTLAVDEVAEGYGIQMIDPTLCEYQFSFHFGLHPAAAGVCSAAVSSTSSVVHVPTASASVIDGHSKTKSQGLPSVPTTLCTETLEGGHPQTKSEHPNPTGAGGPGPSHSGNPHKGKPEYTPDDHPSHSYGPPGDKPEHGPSEDSPSSVKVSVETAVVIVHPVPAQTEDEAPCASDEATPYSESGDDTPSTSGEHSTPSESTWEETSSTDTWSAEVAPPAAPSAAPHYGESGSSGTWVANSTGSSSSWTGGVNSTTGVYRPVQQETNGAMSMGMAGGKLVMYLGAAALACSFV